MPKKTFAAWALALCLCLGLLQGCAQDAQGTAPTTEPEQSTSPSASTEESRAQAFGLSYQSDAGLNPYTCTRLVNRSILSLLYQGLFAITSQYRAEPVLCQSYRTSEDLKTYTFTLVSATFSDGSALTAQDAAASLQAAMGSPVYGNRLRHVTSVTAGEDGSLVVVLDTPYENLPLLLDIPIVRAQDVEEEQPVGTGPYALAGQGGSLRLQRRGNWWSEYPSAVEFDTIVLSEARSPSDIRDQFEFGQTDLVCADPGSSSYVEYRCDYELWDCATGILLYLGCNRGGGVFANSSIRAALTHAVDRSSLAGVYRGFAEPAYLPASPSADYYDETLAAQYGYDPGRFSTALSNAGMRNTNATLLVCGDDPVRVTAAEAVAQALTDCGLTTTVSAKAKDDYQAALEAGNFDLYLGEVRLSPNFDLSPFFQEGGSLPYGSMANAANYALCLAALENSGNYYDLHQAVMEDGQLCPLLVRTYAVYATRGAASSLLPGLDNVFHTANSRQLADAKES